MNVMNNRVSECYPAYDSDVNKKSSKITVSAIIVELNYPFTNNEQALSKST